MQVVMLGDPAYPLMMKLHLGKDDPSKFLSLSERKMELFAKIN